MKGALSKEGHLSRGEKLSKLVMERPIEEAVQEGAYVPGRFVPDRTITPELQRRIDEIAVAYAQGEYADMHYYTINIGKLARSLGMPWGQLKDELSKALHGMERMMKFDKTPVVKLLMESLQR